MRVQARRLGPWSSAMQLVEGRAEALAAREAAKLERAAQQAEQLKSNVVWQPSRDPAQGPRPPQRVPPLVDMCVQLLVDFIEDVESLAGLPDVIRVRSREWMLLGQFPAQAARWLQRVAAGAACICSPAAFLCGCSALSAPACALAQHLLRTGDKAARPAADSALGVQVRLAKAVCVRRKLNPAAAMLFAEAGPGEVVLHECSQLAEADMASLLRSCATPM